MTDFQEPEVQYTASRAAFDQYPLNIVRTDTFRHALESYHKRFADERLFHPRSRMFFLWDLVKNEDGVQAFKPSANLDSVEALSSQLDVVAGDPLWRFAFIQSPSSRDPLGCTKDQLAKLLTHYQVMPAFLDFVFTFKRRTSPLAHALFRHESFLEEDGPPLPLPSLDRSGIQIQHAFNLLSVERSEVPAEKNPWPLRQTALYHSMDVKTGRCFWIILKGNRTIREQIKRAVDQHRLLRPAAITTLEQSFVAALQIHLIVMNWSVESWSEYIDYLEEDVKKISTDVKIAPVTDLTSNESFKRISSMANPLTTPKRDTFSRTLSVPAPALPSPPIPRIVRSVTDRVRRGMGIGSPTTTAGQPAADDEDLDEHQFFVDLDKKFSFTEFQRLSFLGDELERALMVIDQNKGVLAEIRDHYQDVINSHGFTSNMNKASFHGDMVAFFRRIKSIDRDLNIHHARLKALSRTLENDKTMFQAMLQYRSEKGAEFFATSAKVSSERMEDWTAKMHTIAIKTKQDTVSMHVITIFTLVFLPGTFLAVRLVIPLLLSLLRAQATLTPGRQTFFSSGVLRWDEDGTMGSDWVTRPEGLKLFMFICVPMMVIILAGWSVVYWCTRRSMRPVGRMMVGVEHG